MRLADLAKEQQPHGLRFWRSKFEQQKMRAEMAEARLARLERVVEAARGLAAALAALDAAPGEAE